MGKGYKAIWRGGKLFAEYEDGKLIYLDPTYSDDKRSSLPTPMVIRDIGEYRSPLDGTMITSRNQHRDHMRAHDVVEVGNERIGSMSAAADKPAPVNRELGEAIKRHVEEVKAAPESTYREHVLTQKAEHAEVAALVTATV